VPLARLLARAEPFETAAGEQAQLRRWFRVDGPGWPAAAIQRQAEAGDAGAHAWLRADPVHVRADMTGARLMAWDTLGLAGDEADALLADLAATFDEAGIDIGRTAPERWYLRLPPDVPVPGATSAPGDALGEDLFAHLPAGDAGRRWRRLQSDAQILLAAHPVNAARAARGQPTANSLWFWGEGVHPGPVRPCFAGTTVVTGDAQLAALARAAGLETRATDDGVSGLVDLRAARAWDAVDAALAPRLPGALAHGIVLDFGDSPSLRCRPLRWWQRWP
jgi:hypothetical protein